MESYFVRMMFELNFEGWKGFIYMGWNRVLGRENSSLKV